MFSQSFLKDLHPIESFLEAQPKLPSMNVAVAPRSFTRRVHFFDGGSFHFSMTFFATPSTPLTRLLATSIAIAWPVGLVSRAQFGFTPIRRSDHTNQIRHFEPRE
jgi:hypothetical protein